MLGCSFCYGMDKIRTIFNTLVKCNTCDNMLCESHMSIAKQWGEHYSHCDCIMCNDCVLWDMMGV